jgi:ABC-type lipoprotein export system ATPase subunit
MPSSGKPLIEVRNLVKVYRTPAGDFTAVKGMDVEVRQGEFVAVIGKSGSGKSTFINMLAGIDRPTSGEILIGGAPIHTYDESRMAAWRGQNLGIVFQFFQLIPTLTALENVLLPMELNKLYDAAWRRKRAVHLLKRVEMESHADKLPAALSGGQQQRVAIARALANDPPLIVADEPTGNLDSNTAERIFTLFKSLVSGGKTVLMVTHDSDLARRVDRTILISDGQIVNEYLVQALSALTQDQLAEVARRVKPQAYPPNAVIIRQGETGDKFYILVDGKADVLVDAAGGGQVLVNQLGPGNYFGEMALLGNGIRAATVKVSAEAAARVAALDLLAFNDLVDASPGLRQELIDIVERRRQANEVQALSYVKGSELTVVAAGSRRRTFPPGHEIIRQGELGASFFVLEDGVVEVFVRDGEGQETKVDSLKRGSHFGETVVIGDRRRSASFRAGPDGPAHCLEYEAEQFERLIRGSPANAPESREQA